MKKFISMVMAAAMVVSLVPATAFAANDATFKVVKDLELTEKQAEEALPAGPQLQIKVKDVDASMNAVDSYDIKLHINGAEVLEGLNAVTMDDIEEVKKTLCDMSSYSAVAVTNKRINLKRMMEG